jgi:hypothetical protein
MWRCGVEWRPVEAGNSFGFYKVLSINLGSILSIAFIVSTIKERIYSIFIL